MGIAVVGRVLGDLLCAFVGADERVEAADRVGTVERMNDGDIVGIGERVGRRFTPAPPPPAVGSSVGAAVGKNLLRAIVAIGSLPMEYRGNVGICVGRTDVAAVGFVVVGFWVGVVVLAPVVDQKDVVGVNVVAAVGLTVGRENVGLKVGVFVAVTLGLTVGRENVGLKVGVFVAATLGLSVGRENVGLKVGVFVAATLGLTVGRENVGLKVGTATLGLTVGRENVGLKVVTATLGLTVGRENIGFWVGEELNSFTDFVGLLEGDFEGDFVDSGKPEPSSI